MRLDSGAQSIPKNKMNNLLYYFMCSYQYQNEYVDIY